MAVDIERLVGRISSEGRILPIAGAIRGFFDPALAIRFDQANFDGIAMMPRVADAARNRPDRCPVLWSEVRAELLAQTRRLNAAPRLASLYEAMRLAADREAGDSVDLTMFVERVISEPLLDTIVAGLSRRQHAILVANQRRKIAHVLYPTPRRAHGVTAFFPRLIRWADHISDFRAGRAVSRALRRRMSGRSPPQDDYAQAVLRLADRLGLLRATYAVTTILTAIAGAPGTVAACALYELLRHPDWFGRVRGELSALTLEELLADPVRLAPVTHRVLKEVMRLWSFPLMVQRRVLKDFAVDGHAMRAGESYFLSSYAEHRDADVWEEPARFNPDRWLRPSAGGGAYVPFGWASRTCVGASLGLSQHIVFLHLMSTTFDITLLAPGTEYMGLDGIAAPEAMRVRISRRQDGAPPPNRASRRDEWSRHGDIAAMPGVDSPLPSQGESSCPPLPPTKLIA